MNPKTAGGLLLIHTFLTLLLQIFAMAVPSLQAWLGSSSLFGLVTRAAVMQGLLILLPTVFVIVRSHQPAAEITGSRSTPSSLILAAAVGIPAGVVFQGLNNLMLYLLSQQNRAKWVNTAAPDPWSTDIWQQSSQIVLILLIVRVLTPAVVEELMFRGVIQGNLRTRLTPVSAIFWQAVAFALFHNNPLFLLPPLLAGLLLGMLRQNGNSILPSMIAHLSLNLTLLAISPLLPSLTAEYLKLTSRSSATLFYASLIATFIASIALIPLIVMISHLRPDLQSGGRTNAHSPYESGSARRLIPGDWKFALALLILLVTMIVTYLQRI